MDVDNIQPIADIVKRTSPMDRRFFVFIFMVMKTMATANSISRVEANVLICAAIPTSTLNVVAISMSSKLDRMLGVIELNLENDTAGTKSFETSDSFFKIFLT